MSNEINTFLSSSGLFYEITSIETSGKLISVAGITNTEERAALLNKYASLAEKIVKEVQSPLQPPETLTVDAGNGIKIILKSKASTIFKEVFPEYDSIEEIVGSTEPEHASSNIKQIRSTPMDNALEKCKKTRKGLATVDKINDITTWETPEFVVKEFGPNAYNLASIETFKERLALTRDAALQGASDPKAINSLYTKQVEALDTLLRKHGTDLQNFKQRILQQVGLRKDNRKKATSFYEPIHKDGLNICAHFFADVEKILKQDDPKFNLEKAEKEFIAEKPRPTVLHIYQCQNCKLFSLQIPVNEKTIPSSIRDGRGLPNYVQTCHGSIDEKDNFKITYQGVRHSSYPPIAMRGNRFIKGISNQKSNFDYFRRKCKARAKANQFVGEVFTNLAKNMLASDPSLTGTSENPLKVPLRTMMLLTPAQGDRVLRGKDSEVSQLRDTVFALKSYASDKREIEIDGKKIWITPDIQIMNFAANKQAEKAPLHKTDVNTASFIAFQKEVVSWLQKNEINLPDAFTNVFGLESDKNRELSSELQRQYQALNNAYKELNTGKLNAKEEIKNVYRNIEDLSREINRLEQKILNVNQDIFSAQKNGFFRLQKLEVPELLLKIIPPDKKNFLQNFLEAQELYYTGKCYKSPNLIDLQSRYLQLQYDMGNWTEFFCKSGEDRTGAVDDKIQARNAFLAVNHYYPRLNNAVDDEKMKAIELTVHQSSASQANTFYNSRARGLQVSAKIGPNFPAEIEKMQATLAKDVVSASKNMKKSKNNYYQEASKQI